MVKLISCPVNPLWDHATRDHNSSTDSPINDFSGDTWHRLLCHQESQRSTFAQESNFNHGIPPGSPDQISDIFKTKS